MPLSKILIRVFGEKIFNGGAAEVEQQSSQKGLDPPLMDQIHELKLWLNNKLDAVAENCRDRELYQESIMVSKLGPDKVSFYVDGQSDCRISYDRLTVRSQGSFDTIKANVCVFGGKWMYEVQLHSKGVMQIGWSSNDCTFNENSGVGDTVRSYGYDGSKQQKWHMSTNKYGEYWQTGDTIGVCFDMEQSFIEYYRNGVSQGKAFTDIEKGPNIVYYPAVSLGYNEGVKANFGNSPLRFPVAGYNTLQAIPYGQIEKARLLLRYVLNLAAIIARPKHHEKEKKVKEHRFSSKKTIYVLLSSVLIEKLSEVILDAYVIEEVLLPHIINHSTLRNEADKASIILPGSANSTLGSLLSLFWNYLEAAEMQFVLKKLLNILLYRYLQTAEGLENESQCEAIAVLNSLCTHPPTRRFYLENKFFKKHCILLLLYLRPPEYEAMKNTLPDDVVWSEGLGGSKENYNIASERLATQSAVLYNLQIKLLRTLLINTDTDSSLSSSRKIFTKKLRKYVMDATIEQRPLQSLFLMQSGIYPPVESPVSFSFLCVLLDVIRQLIEEDTKQQFAIDPKLFFDGTLLYPHFDRIGGVLSHLHKAYRSDMMQELGIDGVAILNVSERTSVQIGDVEAVYPPINNSNSISIFERARGNASTSFPDPLFFRRKSKDLATENTNEIYELLDVAILFYYTMGHKYIVKMSAVRDELAALNIVLIETKSNQEVVARQLKELAGKEKGDLCKDILTDLKRNFEERNKVFTDRSLELARKQAWYRSVALGAKRRKLFIWLLTIILNTLRKSSEMGSLFAFVPEVYINILPIILDTVLDFSFHDLCLQFDTSDDSEEIFAAATFLAEHTADPRIVLASCKDSLLQALGTLVCHDGGVRALEKTPQKSQDALIRALLRPYENRAWGQSNWLLLRCWLGEGFGYRDSRPPSIWQGGEDPLTVGLCRSRAKSETHTGLLHHVAPANPSRHFQNMIGMQLIENEPAATAFLNSVLNQLNWAFSEFILLLQEIQNSANRQENSVFDSKHMKICSMCFELTVSLMRCLEMIIFIAPDIVQDPSRPNSDLILNRICQLISQVLSRVTVPPGCFQFIVDICAADLSPVTHYSIMTAALGILLALLGNEIDCDDKPAKISRITRSLLTDPSFQVGHLEFALGNVETPILQLAETPRGNFDPQTRAHIDPLTNDLRVPLPSTSKKRIRSDPPVIKFSLMEYPLNVSEEEVRKVRKLIELLRIKQSLLSDITLPSEDSLCPICCDKPLAVSFRPCGHQSCSNCILQHLINSKLCFYCKTLITNIEGSDGTMIYEATDILPTH